MDAISTAKAHMKVEIITLADAGRRMHEVGAKAARLGALQRSGERVPDGFCIVGSGDAALALARDAYRQLGPAVAVAVRSSALAEDGSEASFAGQFETILNVRGEQALGAALERCWASVSAGRIQAYRSHKGQHDGAPLQLAVLVQRMIEPRAAGVAFSANPLTGARDEVVIEATAGLGDAVVSGETIPDSFTVLASGGVHARIQRTGAPALTEQEARDIATLVRRIEAGARAPQDVEWALDESGLWLLQARPITALPDAVHWESPVPGAKWLKDLQAAEWAKEPLSPLGATTTFATMIAARERWRTWPPAPKHQAPWHALINGWLYMRSDHKPLSLVAMLAGSVLAILAGTLNGHRRAQRTWPPRLARLDAVEQVKRATLPDTALRAQSDSLLGELAWWWLEVVWFAAIGRTSEQIIGWIGLLDVPSPSALFRDNDSLLLESARALRRAAADPGEVENYLARFGHFVESADPIHPTLRESPEHLAWQLAAARRSSVDLDERLAQARRARAAGEPAIRTLRGPRGFLARRALAAGQSHVAHIDDAVFHFQRVLAALRATFLEAGKRLADLGKIEQAVDVFYLERSELWGTAPAVDLTARIMQRRALRERCKRLAPPPFIPPSSDPTWAKDPLVKLMSPAMRAALFERGLQERYGRRVLVGTPGSPGRARGIARVVVGTADFDRFQPGEILVARATSPIWTPVLGIAAAAVTEVGGPFAHAAIVAREFGIPLVDGALDATRVIADGMPVMVDGSAGIVEF